MADITCEPATPGLQAPAKDSTAVNAFFYRCGLAPANVSKCHEVARRRFPSSQIHPAPFQGYCSYTLLVGASHLVQFRPPSHELNVAIAADSLRVFGGMAPQTEYLGVLAGLETTPAAGAAAAGDTATGSVHAYALSRITGSSLSEFRKKQRTARATPGLVRDFAKHFATGWAAKRSRYETATSVKGKVGATIAWRVDLMLRNLPVAYWPIVAAVRRNLDQLEQLPWVLSHGDLVTDNVMVEPTSGRLCGLIDWAEGEWLPFGVGMYGLEELLGSDADAAGFEYFPEASELRALFWAELSRHVPELASDVTFLRSVQLAQVLGILLWHGIAFDDGNLDRVVQPGRDDGELQRLETFLLSSGAGRGVFPVVGAPIECPGRPQPQQVSESLLSLYRRSVLKVAGWVKRRCGWL